MIRPATHHLITACIASLLPLLVLNVTGCANTAIEPQVIRLANRDIAALTADDIVCVMQRAGFSDERIMDLGTDLRNSLASTGAAKIVIDEKVEAILAVDGNYLHVASRRTGSSIYNLRKHGFR